jgi:hypothetical protein
MFVRAKKSGAYQYLQVVENYRDDGRVRQRVIATLGRLDVLQSSGQLDGLLSSCARFTTKVSVLDAYRQGAVPPAATVRIGPPMVFDRLWHQLGIDRVIERALRDRKFEFPVERAVFVTVLHRLFDPGSDRAAEKWRADYAIDGADDLELHQLYRAMAWLGQPLPNDQQMAATPFAPRCTKDLIEEMMFARQRDLFSGLDLVFFDTTSIYFEGEGGDTIGARGYSKDHRRDLKQMVVGVVLDGAGRPLCCEMWPGNTTDVKTLIPVVERLKERFAIRSVCVVADRGMISQHTIRQLAKLRIHYILGVRLRKSKEVNDDVLTAAGQWEEIFPARTRSSKDPAPLRVKEVRVGPRRYVVCSNTEQAAKDRADREAIVAALGDKLKQADTSLVGNKGYRKYLSTANSDQHFVIDPAKIERDARYDGLWVLQTDTDLPSAEVALKYKQLWMVETTFRAVKSVLRTRPIYHKTDETIRGHVFCSFLALVLHSELNNRLGERGWQVEWDDLRHDLDRLEQIKIKARGAGFVIRSEVRGAAGKAFKAAGLALPPTVQPLSPNV